MQNNFLTYVIHAQNNLYTYLIMISVMYLLLRIIGDTYSILYIIDNE